MDKTWASAQITTQQTKQQNKTTANSPQNHSPQSLLTLTTTLKPPKNLQKNQTFVNQGSQPLLQQIDHEAKSKNWSIFNNCLYIVNLIVGSIEQNQALECNFIHLFIPLAYIQALKLTLLQAKNKQQTYAYDLLMAILKKIQVIKQMQPLQIQESAFYDVSSECLNYFKHTNDGEEYYLIKLRAFLDKYKTIMNNYVPLYYQYFNVVANYRTIFGQKTKIHDVRAYLEQLKKKVASRFTKSNQL